MSKIDWKSIESVEDLDEMVDASKSRICLVFKYSTRCGSSAVALDRLERSWDLTEMTNVQPYFLDLIRYRDLSNQIVDRFNVMHESPQILLIENTKSHFDTSHFSISYEVVRQAIDRMTVKNGNG